MKRKHTTESITTAIQEFIKKFNREPTYTDFHIGNNLPTSRTVERRFGGLRAIRKDLNLYTDHRAGSKRTEKAKEINKRAAEWNKNIYKKLLTFFKEPFVHKESSIFDDTRNRTDFKVYGKKTFLVDIFYPQDRRSLHGCVRLKTNKYPNNLRDYIDKTFDKVIFLNVNDGVLNDVPLSPHFTVMSLSEFWNYCKAMV